MMFHGSRTTTFFILASSLLPTAESFQLGRNVCQDQTWRECKRSRVPLMPTVLSASQIGSSAEEFSLKSEEDENIFRLQKFDGRRITLIGTAHLSKKSNEQVVSFIESDRPDAVLVELDRTRLPRLGLTEADLGPQFVTADDIFPIPLEDDKLALENKQWWDPLKDLLLDGFSRLARGMLTGVYDDMGRNMGTDKLDAGGEFLAAINAAKKVNPSTKILLGDRDSVLTMRRAAELALRSGDPLSVLGRFNDASQEEMKTIEKQVREEMEGRDEKEINVAMVETVKNDKQFQTRLFGRLEREVPEFTRSFLTERDYIMSEAMRREEEADHIVGVVGMAHVPGLIINLEKNGFKEICN
mmetsp:Transcript_37123/g.86564  ORF Transcript_37123/g.86564 Transcript_37123/m.86564 type:complete len:356 (-) Transcript_37123:325-1392(-)